MPEPTEEPTQDESDEEPKGDIDEPRGLIERFPALRKLALWGRGRRIPLVQQMAATECGAACLAMVLGLHGRAVRLEEVREVMGIGRDGATALAILDAAEWYGLRGRGVRLEVEDLDYLEAGAILHWEFNHFLVFERLRPGAVDVVDPAGGRRRVPMEQFRRSFTGVALLLEPSESFEEKKPEGSHLFQHAKKVLGRTGGLQRILATSILLQVFALAVPALTSALVDRVVPRADLHLLWVLCAGLSALLAFHYLASLIRAHLLLHLRTYLDARMTLGFCDHLVSLPYAFFQQRSAGDLMMRLNSNATVREILTSGTLSGLLDGSLVILYLGILLFASPAMGALVLGLGLLQLGVFLVAKGRQRELMSRDLEAQSRSQSYQVEMLSGIETLKAMGSERRAVEHWSALFVDVLNVSLLRGNLQAHVDSVTSTLRVGSPLAILVFGAHLVLSGQMTLGTMLGLSALAGGFLGPLSNLVSTAGQLQLLRSYTARIDDVLEAPPEQSRDQVNQPPKLMGEIQLDEVSFRYAAHGPLVVRDVSVKIRPGQFVALVGRSGSGKSTLASLLLGLYQPTSGRILYDGLDLRELDLRAVRRQLGIVPQQPYLFGGTIRANIALSDPTLPLPQIIEAAQRAHIHEEIMEMAMQYETLLIDRGASLSGGQRQRVALARALLRGPAILFLDEATSALDAVTEAAIQRELQQMRCTRIVIAHRMSTIAQADLILVLEDGRVVEQGTHESLRRQGGVYAQLVQAQIDAD